MDPPTPIERARQRLCATSAMGEEMDALMDYAAEIAVSINVGRDAFVRMAADLYDRRRRSRPVAT